MKELVKQKALDERYFRYRLRNCMGHKQSMQRIY